MALPLLCHSQATYLPIVPPTVVQLTKSAAVGAADFASVLSFSYGGAPAGHEIDAQFRRKFPRQIQRQGA